MGSDPERDEHAGIVEEIVRSWALIASNVLNIPATSETSWFQEMSESMADKALFLDPRLVEMVMNHPEDWLRTNPKIVRHQLFYAMLANASPELVSRFIDRVVENTYDDHTCNDCVGDTRIMLGLVQIPANRLRRKLDVQTRKLRARGLEYPTREYALV